MRTDRGCCIQSARVTPPSIQALDIIFAGRPTHARTSCCSPGAAARKSELSHVPRRSDRQPPACWEHVGSVRLNGWVYVRPGLEVQALPWMQVLWTLSALHASLPQRPWTGRCRGNAAVGRALPASTPPFLPTLRTHTAQVHTCRQRPTTAAIASSSMSAGIAFSSTAALMSWLTRMPSWACRAWRALNTLGTAACGGGAQHATWQCVGVRGCGCVHMCWSWGRGAGAKAGCMRARNAHMHGQPEAPLLGLARTAH